MLGSEEKKDFKQSHSLICAVLNPLQEYAKHQITKPRKHLDMEHIQQPNDRDSKCDCVKNKEVNIIINSLLF